LHVAVLGDRAKRRTKKEIEEARRGKGMDRNGERGLHSGG